VIGKERQDTFNKIVDIVVEKLNVQKSMVQGPATLEDLGADSLDIIEIIMKIEEQFDVQVDDDVVENLKTLDQVVDYVHNLRVNVH
jgi:acyl carrier protein